VYTPPNETQALKAQQNDVEMIEAGERPNSLAISWQLAPTLNGPEIITQTICFKTSTELKEKLEANEALKEYAKKIDTNLNAGLTGAITTQQSDGKKIRLLGILLTLTLGLPAFVISYLKLNVSSEKKCTIIIDPRQLADHYFNLTGKYFRGYP
jgi:hypothetical protein